MRAYVLLDMPYARIGWFWGAFYNGVVIVKFPGLKIRKNHGSQLKELLLLLLLRKSSGPIDFITATNFPELSLEIGPHRTPDSGVGV